MKIVLPHKFKCRDYQLDVLKAFFIDRKRRFINVWHRRAGKDKLWLNIMIAASQERVGTYLYTLPKLTQARKVIWEGIDKDGMRFMDHIPDELIDGEPNNTEMMVRFKNGSIFRLGGSDHYNSLMGTNPVAIVNSEFSLQNPLAWDYLRPILTENGGWASFVFTPRGTNHAYQLYENVKDNPDWYCNLLTVNDTKRKNGSKVFTDELIQQERETGMSDDMINQEYYCSFTAAVRGAYFSEQLRRAEEQDRIKEFLIDTSSPVYTYWDLGISDNTAIWFIQEINNIPHAIMYYENNGKNLQHYINFLNDFRSKYGIIYGGHYMPHDSGNRNLQTGKTMIDFAKDLGLSPISKVSRCKKKIDAIETGRHALDNIVIHIKNCAHGLSCLREYHAEFYDKIGTYGEHPFHNWASHGADAFMTFAQSWKSKKETPSSKVFYNAFKIKI